MQLHVETFSAFTGVGILVIDVKFHVLAQKLKITGKLDLY